MDPGLAGGSSVVLALGADSATLWWMTVGSLQSLWTERLCLRCWSAEDTEVLSATIANDLAHLRAFLPWAEREPLDRAARREWMARVETACSLDTEYFLGIWSRADGSLLGGHGLHPVRKDGPFETGYWVVSHQLRRGIAREATVAVTRYALMVRKLDALMIRVRPENLPSRAVAESLGYSGPFARVTDPGDRCGADQEILVYTINAQQCAQQPWAHEPLMLIDGFGRVHRF